MKIHSDSHLQRELAWMDPRIGLIVVPLYDDGTVIVDFDVGEPTGRDDITN